MGMMENVFISVEKNKCTLDLSKFGYKKGKWQKLLRTYIDWEEWKKFKEKLGKASSLSLTYYFKQKKINNGSCLIALVLTRTNRNEKWNKVNLLYRTTELQRRFSADLVLLHHLINNLPECCGIKEITFYMPNCYCDAMFVNGYLNYFDVKLKDLDETHPWIRTLKNVNKKYFQKEHKTTTFLALKRMQDLYFGNIKFESIPIDSLTLEEVFEKPVKGGKIK